MNIHVMTEEGEIEAGFLVRLPGWTEKRFFAEAPESRRWEYKDGEAIVHAPPSILHQDLALLFLLLLGGYVEERKLGEVFPGLTVLRLRPELVLEPDAFYVSRHGAARIGTESVDGPADLVVEIVLPETRHYDLVEKARDYLEAGVLEYWAINPKTREVRQHTRRSGGTPAWDVVSLKEGRLESTAVPGFWIDAGWLWEDPLPDASSKLAAILGQDLPK